MKLLLTCDWCGKAIERYPSQLKPHNFCSRDCLANFSSREKNPENYQDLKDLTGVSVHMSKLNRQLNPDRMTFDTRCKLREARLNSGEGVAYEKCFGKHTHRIIAERMLGRPLKRGEVVHHIDGNRRNNGVENLMVFPTQSDHVQWH
jgi:hypothetical protein